MLTPAQQEQRLDGITATDVAAILGQHPYRSRIDVWREKRGESKPMGDNDRTKWGELLEPVIRRDYEERHGVRVTVPGTLRSDGADWMVASPDGIVWRDADQERGLEIKCHTVRLAHLYGEPGTDEVPAYELCQCMWGMGVTGLPRWDLVPFIDNQTRDYTIERDDELIGIMRDSAERFLVDNVRAGVQPEPDGTEAYDRYLKAKWTTNTARLIDIGNDEDTFDLIERGKALREQSNANEAALDEIEQRLKLRIGDSAGLTWGDANGKPLKLTWKYETRTDVDYAGIVATMMHEAAITASATKPTIEAMVKHLRKLGNLAGSPTGPEIAEMITALRDVLVSIAKNASEASHTTKSQVRPLRWPHQWNKTKKGK